MARKRKGRSFMETWWLRRFGVVEPKSEMEPLMDTDEH
jgi:hypothetical protein